MTDSEDFPVWLRRQLDRREWSAAELARRMEAAPSRVSEWLGGKYLPNPSSCLRLADALSVDADEVLARAGHRMTAEPLAADDDVKARLIELVRRAPMTSSQAAGLESMLLTWIELAESDQDNGR